MKTTELLEKKIDNLITAIRKDMILKSDAYNQFAGYTKALTEFGIISLEEAKHFRLELAKVLF